MSPLLRRLVLIAVGMPCSQPLDTLTCCGRCAGCEASRLAREIILAREMEEDAK